MFQSHQQHQLHQLFLLLHKEHRQSQQHSNRHGTVRFDSSVCFSLVLGSLLHLLLYQDVQCYECGTISSPNFTLPTDTVKFDSGDRSLLAVQALGLATLNVMSFGVMLVGGISWAFDLSSIEELRQRTQAVTRRPGMVSPEDEKAMEELIEGLMGKMGMEKPQKPSSILQEDEK
ncbi:hypothetical protein FVEG_01944 [Fusarium verticillioides 7600]|uniref:Altered inheritance of mitochondria protein 11 n=1 Tax=Gibberella moniliformis (strain M3125 / FGSC 7600) TaxID=334819 RepID=W7LHD3_GIBM7|nr:hypothetical protein FVEG_01944 [Fusarium verticillioides 7600]EWG38848.1 hypothetical protein FVEG_01944 [Fusarium verticillioides 7600]